MTRSGPLALVLLLAALWVACSQSASIRSTTYPRNFQYLSDEELESVMWRLAGRVYELERLSTHSEPDYPAMATVLERIDHEARQLRSDRVGPTRPRLQSKLQDFFRQSDGVGSTHPYLQSKLQDFLQHVERARMDLRRSPPIATNVDDVWRACSGCHERS
jgi:hypothetical protein